MKLLLSTGLLLAPAALAQSVVQIHPAAYSEAKCLDVRGGAFANGTPVEIFDCNGSAAQQWIIQRNSTTVQLSGTNFCLDAGSTPGNGVGLKIWECFANLPAQTWFYTDDDRIALQNQGLCLDLTNGDITNGNQVQTWACTADDVNQVWDTTPGFTPPPPPTVVQIHPGSSSSKCLDVRAADFENGTPVQIYDCNGSSAQNWNIARGSTAVTVNGTNFCLDAGATPGNGTGMKIWECFDNLPAQEWFYTDDNRIALENQGFCLDLAGGNVSNGNQIQIWACTDNDVNQIWTV